MPVGPTRDMTSEILPPHADDFASETSAAARAHVGRPDVAGSPADLAPQATVVEPLDHATIRAIVAGIMLAMFLSALEQTIVAPEIGRAHV